MGAARFDDALIFLHQAAKSGGQQVDGRKELVLDLHHCGDVHGGGEGVVGALGHVGVVVGVDQFLAGDFISPPGDDLVDVHVGLGAASRLPNSQGKMGVQFPFQDLIADLRDDLKAPLIQFAQAVVCHGGGLL